MLGVMGDPLLVDLTTQATNFGATFGMVLAVLAAVSMLWGNFHER